MPAFSLAAHEVTIGEYDDFLRTLDGLPADRRNAYDHASQPAAKSGHLPADWDEMLAAAKSGGQWQGRAMSMACPVVNVDWWDAMAYCDKAYKMPAAKLGEQVTMPFGNMKGSRLWALMFNVAHNNEHYGNLVTYFRLKNMVPPSSQGTGM